ncbi:7-cyano-7-deazaguanine synthase QueC [Elusimicrobiota bacterium]
MSKKAVILLSGGMDSAVCMAIARDAGYELYPLTVNYSQKNQYEIKSAKKLSRFFGAKKHIVMKIDLGKFGGSALTGDIQVPHVEEENCVPITYVPARNLVLLSVAVSWAEVIGAGSVFIGANVRDYSGYPDCRLDFLRHFEKAADLGTRKETRVTIRAPLINMSKRKIISEGLRLGVDFSMTSSCYEPALDGSACGECTSCRIRDKGFLEAENYSKEAENE